MEQEFYKGRMVDRFGLKVLIPDTEGRDIVHRIIYEELVRGVIKSESRALYQTVIENLAQSGRPGGHPRLHGDRPADQAGGLSYSQLRYHSSARAGRGGVGAWAKESRKPKRHQATKCGRKAKRRCIRRVSKVFVGSLGILSARGKSRFAITVCPEGACPCNLELFRLLHDFVSAPRWILRYYFS